MAKTQNEIWFKEMRDRINGALPALPHRGRRRLADDQDITDLPGRILNQEVPWYGYDGKRPTHGRKTVTLAAIVGWMDTGLSNIMVALKTNGDKLDLILKKLDEK